jgi:hypothetical protein
MNEDWCTSAKTSLQISVESLHYQLCHLSFQYAVLVCGLRELGAYALQIGVKVRVSRPQSIDLGSKKLLQLDDFLPHRVYIEGPCILEEGSSRCKDLHKGKQDVMGWGLRLFEGGR